MIRAGALDQLDPGYLIHPFEVHCGGVGADDEKLEDSPALQTVNLSFIITNIKDELTDLCGN